MNKRKGENKIKIKETKFLKKKRGEKWKDSN